MINFSTKQTKSFRLIIIPILFFTLIIWGAFFVFLDIFKVNKKEFLQKYNYLIKHSIILNFLKDFQILNNLLNSYAVWTDFYNAVKSNNITFLKKVWQFDREIKKCDSYGVITQNNSVFFIKNPILNSSQIKQILSYIKKHAKIGDKYKFFDFFIKSPKNNSYYLVAISPLSNTDGYILSYDFLFFSKKLNKSEIEKLTLSRVKIVEEKNKRAFYSYPLKNIENKTIGYLNFLPPNWLESYFKILFIFVFFMTIAIYLFGLFLIYLTAVYVSKEKEKNIKKFLENLKLICFSENKLSDNLFNEIIKLVFYDPLTSAYNRKYFFHILKKEVKRAKRFNHHLSLIYIDLDDFKKINDTYGHQVGDEILKFFSNLISQNIRKIDIFARLGGEEFVILLPEMSLKNAIKVANRILDLIKNTTYKDIKLSASIGVTSLKKDDTFTSFLERADKAMYLAKKSGKGKVKVL